MAEKQNITIRVPPDTYEEFETYRKTRDISKADAGRRLLHEALRQQTSDSEQDARGDPEGFLESLLSQILVLSGYTLGISLVLWGVSALLPLGWFLLAVSSLILLILSAFLIRVDVPARAVGLYRSLGGVPT